MADLSRKDLESLARLFANEMARVMPREKRGASSHSSSNDSSDKKKEAREEAKLDINVANKSIKDLSKILAAASKDMEDYHKGISTSGRSYAELSQAQSTLLKSITQHERVTNAAQDKLRDQIKESISSQSKLGEALAKGANSMSDLVDRLDESSEALEDYERTVSDSTKANLANLKTKKAMKDALRELTKTTIATDTQFMKSGKKIDDMSTAQLKAAINEVKEKVAANQQMLKTSQDVTQSFMGLYIWSDRLRMVTGEVSKAFGGQVGWMGQMATAAGAIALVVNGIKGMYGDFRKLSGVGLANTFMESSLGAIRMGISMEDFTKMMKDNQNQLAQLSLTGFIDNVTKNQDKLIALGEGTDGAARGIAAMTDSAIQSGIDIRNDTALQDSIDKQVRSFTTLRALTGQTAEEFAKTNQQIMGTADFTKKMAHLDKTKRAQLIDGINKERERLALMGLSNDQQVQYLNTINKMLGENVEGRLNKRAALMQTASMGGVDQQTIQELDRILLKGSAATAKEQAYLAEVMQGAVANVDSHLADLYANGQEAAALAYTNTFEAASKGAEGMIDTFRQANVSQSTKGVSETELDKRISQARLDGDAVTMVKSIAQLEQALKNPMVATAAGVAALVVLATMQLKRNDASLKMFQGKNVKERKPKGKLFGGLRDSIKSLGSKLDDRASKYAFTGGAKGAVKQSMGRAAAFGGMAVKDPLSKLTKGITGAIATPFTSLKDAYDSAYSDNQGMSYASKSTGHFGKIQYTDENGKTKFQSDGSSLRQRKGETEEHFKARRAGHQERYNSMRDTINRSDSDRKKSGRKAVGSKVVKTAMAPIKGVFSMAGKAAGAIGSMGAKAIPFIGWAIAGFQAISGGMDAAADANKIFGLKAEEAATTSQKVSAGIAGALSALTFGMVDVNSTANMLDSYLATDSEGNIAGRLRTVIADTVSSIGMGLAEAAELIPNAIADGVAWLIGGILRGIKTAVVVVWDMVTGLGSKETQAISSKVTSFIGNIGGHIIDSFKFIGDSIINIFAKAINAVYKEVASWVGYKAGDLFETRDVKFGNRKSIFDAEGYNKDSKQIADDRKKEKEAIKARKKAYAEEDKIRAKKAQVEKKEVVDGKARNAEAERLRKARLSAIKNIGVVNGINAKLSEEQLAAQGVDALAIERAHLKEILGESYKITGEDGSASQPPIEPVVNEDGLKVVQPKAKAEEQSKADQTITTAEGTFDRLLKLVDDFVSRLFGNTSAAVNTVDKKIGNVANKDAGIRTTERQLGIVRNGQKFQVTDDEWKKIQEVNARRESQIKHGQPVDDPHTPERVQAIIDQRAKDGTTDKFIKPFKDFENANDFFRDATPVDGGPSQMQHGKNMMDKLDAQPVVATEIEGANGVLSPSGLLKAEEERKAQLAKQQAAKAKAEANQSQFNEKKDAEKAANTSDINTAIESPDTLVLLQKLVDQGERALVLKEKQIQEESVNNLRNSKFGGESQHEFFNKNAGIA